MAETPALSLVKYFVVLPDPRRRHRRRHRLLDIIAIALCAVIAGANTWKQMGLWGKRRRSWLETFLELPEGIPSADTIRRVFAKLKPDAFHQCFRAWVQAITAAMDLKHIAIDGKTLRHSGRPSACLGPLHLVSAWATEQHISLGQVAVDTKSNEITAIPKLLALLELKGALVTMDAMGCQKEIARQIKTGGGDYVLTVKDNQSHLLEDIQESFTKALDSHFAGLEYDEYATTEQGHGRQERRSYIIIHDPQELRHREEWEDLQTIGMCISERTVREETTTEVRYFIGSRRMSAKRYGQALRKHWGIENNCHWQLDIAFREDSNQTQQRNAAENLALLRRMALTCLKRHPEKESIESKRWLAALDVSFLEEVLQVAVEMEKE
jgi:predicted transposase YbfD/YdcC